MLKNNRVRLQSLLIVTMSSYIFNVNALDSVAGYEKSLIENAKQASSVKFDKIEAGNYDINQLAIELNKRGWTVNKDNDGSLILKPSLVVEKKIDNKAVDNKVEHWQQIKKRFNQAGWNVSRDTDGSLRLSTKKKQKAIIVKKEPAKATTIVNKTNKTKNISFHDMKKQLEETGWNVTNNSDGSLLLYPPEKVSPSFPKNCYGSPTTVDIELPVNSWQKAYDVVHGWLQAHAIKNAAVGKIRKIINIYVVSIVTTGSPYTLLQQVAIKNQDGAVISLD